METKQTAPSLPDVQSKRSVVVATAPVFSNTLTTAGKIYSVLFWFRSKTASRFQINPEINSGRVGLQLSLWLMRLMDNAGAGESARREVAGVRSHSLWQKAEPTTRPLTKRW
jgi:hypothetical protein